MSFHDLFAWFCKNEGVIYFKRTDGMKEIKSRVGKKETKTTVTGSIDYDEFGAEIADLIQRLYNDSP
jgi:hypothetical protein